MLKLVEKVPVDLVSLAEIKMHLRLDQSFEDEYLKGLYSAAYEIIEQYLNRCLLSKKWELTVSCKQKGMQKINLPYAPILELIKIEQFFIINQPKPIKRFFLSIHKEQIEIYTEAPQVIICYSAGYGEFPQLVPAPIKQAVLILIAELYENRQNFAIEQHTLLQALLHPYRNLTLG